MKLIDFPFLADLVALRRDIHAHPELAYKENRTADLVARELATYGLEVHRGLAGTGVVGVLKGRRGEGVSIGLRADMDALPLDEKNGFAHRSTAPGCMHACGHDGHTAMLLGAARVLAEKPDFAGTVNFIFQPAEETEGGAETMIAEGLFQRFPMQQVFGLHNWPGLPVGQMAVMPGPVMAGTSTFEIRLSGQGCHAAMPDQGTDTILAGAQLVTALQSIVSRNLHPCDAGVVSVTQFHAGDAWNIVPDEALLRGTIRSFRPDVQQTIEQSVKRLCAGIGAAFGVEIIADIHNRYPPTVNSVAETQLCREAAAVVLGENNVLAGLKPSMGAEDFAYMLQQKPGCYVWLGNGPGEGGCTLHNPHYDFNDQIIPIGVSYWVKLVEEILGRG